MWRLRSRSRRVLAFPRLLFNVLDIHLLLALTANERGLLADLKGVKLDIYEQQASFGGVWNYSNDSNEAIDIPQTNPNQPLEEPLWHDGDSKACDSRLNSAAKATLTSPMYEHLETNIPHSLMKFSDAPSLERFQLFPTREAVTRYLDEYGQEVRHLVHFQTQVVDVQQKSQKSQQGWFVRTKNLHHPDIVAEREYDAVVVANGHYTVPNLPAIEGIREWDEMNKGVISHSKSYRRSQPFTNKKVIIVGNSASAIDIAAQIGKVCKGPLLNSTRSGPALLGQASYCEIVAEITEFLPSDHGTKAVRFSDGRIERDIDAILFCTGYFYSFPFLSLLSPKVTSTGDRVQHLYKHIWYIPDPTLVFVGLPYKIIPFRTVEGQVAVITRVWSHRLDLPSEPEMREWEEARIAESGAGKSFHVLPIPTDLEYYNEMIAWASDAQRRANDKLPPPWTEKDKWLREKFPMIKKAFADRGEERYKVRTVEDLGFNYECKLRTYAESSIRIRK